MLIFDPIFGIYFLPIIQIVVERIHKIISREPGYTGDYLKLDGDAKHQSEKSEHPV
ncbi:hypothetical protein [Roseburia sp. 831b]|uniref:hypothetical protein n=1 Tax=Roseburia sp. 831b TaxID=1261635 RepID=UPI001356403A|nr:hypothetical protein [Roseburia sp. 831b]WVK74310.1 hypothetical protein BIV16_07275 [Roseburia sp. 831b]